MPSSRASISAEQVIVKQYMQSNGTLTTGFPLYNVTIQGPAPSRWEIVLAIVGSPSSAVVLDAAPRSTPYTSSCTIPNFANSSGMPVSYLSVPCTLTVNFYDRTSNELLATASMDVGG